MENPPRNKRGGGVGTCIELLIIVWSIALGRKAGMSIGNMTRGFVSRRSERNLEGWMEAFNEKGFWIACGGALWVEFIVI